MLLEDDFVLAMSVNVLRVEAGGESKLLRLVKEPKAEERKERMKSYSAPLATTRC